MQMHDFCLTLPYGLFLCIGGVIGFFKSGSMTSIVMGGGLGALLMFFGKQSLDNYNIINKDPSYMPAPQTLYEDDNNVNDEDDESDQNGDPNAPKVEVPTIYSLFFSLIISIIVSLVMGLRYLETGKTFPPGVVGGISVFMSLFYVYKMIFQREHVPHAKKP